METISTPLTFFFKFIFSTMWFFACGILLMHPKMGFPLIILLITLPVFAFWEFSRIKKVEMDLDYLYVSNYFRKEQISLDNIDGITDNIFLNSHPVTFHLKEPCSFGKKIVFMPRMKFLFYQHHPIVQELKNILDAREFRKTI